MCRECGCQAKPARTERPEECSPEQIRECHGDVKEHPCVEKKEE